MEFLSNFRKKQEQNKLQAIEQEANYAFTIQPYNGGLSYAYNGVPMVAIEPSTAAKDIVAKLQDFKTNYINFKKEHHGQTRIAAAF